MSVSPTLWPGGNPLSVPCNGTYGPSVPVNATASAGRWTFTFTASGAAGEVATATGTLTEQPKPILQSTNWSGYVVPSSGLITEVSGRFTVPTLNCSLTPNAGMSTWVGIGGYRSSGDLLQTGIRSDCVSGVQAVDPAWWEEYPELPEIDFKGMSVAPGDQIEASVYRWSNGAAWETCLHDLTTGVYGLMVTGQGWGVTTGGCGGSFTLQGSTASLTYAGGSTAEWIVEDYVRGKTLAPFANYGTITFANLTTSLSPWYLATADELEIVQNGVVLSVPSAPQGSGFSVTYQ